MPEGTNIQVEPGQTFSEPEKPVVPTQPVQEPQPKGHFVPEADFKRIKETARSKGREEVESEFTVKARQLGFASVEEMFAYSRDMRNREVEDVEKARSRPTPTARKGSEEPDEKPTRSAKGSDESVRYERERAAWQAERDRLSRQLQDAESLRRQAQQDHDAAQAEIQLRNVAFSVGLKEVDYALHLLDQKMQGMSEEDVDKFDERAFFASLRETHPYLFGVVEERANTGPAGKGGPSSGTKVNGGGQKPVGDMSKQEFSDFLRSRGYQPPSV